MADIPHKNNFDFLRLTLAFTVFLSHLGEVSGTQAFHPLEWYFYSGVAVDCFFVLSGFLIFRSYSRSTSLLSYCNKRVRRIVPAYMTVVLLSAFILPFLTSTTNIFFSGQWCRYLFSNLIFLNFLQPDLPGVFTTNPLQVINAPLWTIKIELMFYCSVPLIFLLLKNSKKWLVLCLIYAASVAYSMIFLHLHHTSGLPIYQTLAKQLPGQLAFFLGGGAIYLYFDFFQKHCLKLFIPALIFLLCQGHTLMPALYPLALAITVIFFATFFPYLGNWGKYGDISYGVYIYHFPIIQIFTAYNLFHGHPWKTFFFLIVTILCISACSYHLVERPFLRKNSHYRQVAEEQASS